jgi:hypothetical protein
MGRNEGGHDRVWVETVKCSDIVVVFSKSLL